MQYDQSLVVILKVMDMSARSGLPVRENIWKETFFPQGQGKVREILKQLKNQGL